MIYLENAEKLSSKKNELQAKLVSIANEIVKLQDNIDENNRHIQVLKSYLNINGDRKKYLEELIAIRQFELSNEILESSIKKQHEARGDLLSKVKAVEEVFAENVCQAKGMKEIQEGTVPGLSVESFKLLEQDKKDRLAFLLGKQMDCGLSQGEMGIVNTLIEMAKKLVPKKSESTAPNQNASQDSDTESLKLIKQLEKEMVVFKKEAAVRKGDQKIRANKVRGLSYESFQLLEKTAQEVLAFLIGKKIDSFLTHNEREIVATLIETANKHENDKVSKGVAEIRENKVRGLSYESFKLLGAKDKIRLAFLIGKGIDSTLTQKERKSVVTLIDTAKKHESNKKTEGKGKEKESCPNPAQVGGTFFASKEALDKKTEKLQQVPWAYAKMMEKRTEKEMQEYHDKDWTIC